MARCFLQLILISLVSIQGLFAQEIETRYVRDYKLYGEDVMEDYHRVLPLNNNGVFSDYIAAGNVNVDVTSIQKLNYLGDIYWTLEVPANDALASYPVKIVEGTSNDYYVGGTFGEVIHLSADGKLIKKISITHLINTTAIYLFDFDVVADGFIYSGRYMDEEVGTNVPYLGKYSFSGELIWEKLYWDLDITKDVVGWPDFEIDADNNILYNASTSTKKKFIYKYDQAGNQLWHKTTTLPEVTGVDDYPSLSSLAGNDDAGNYYLLTRSTENAPKFLVKFDKDGANFTVNQVDMPMNIQDVKIHDGYLYAAGDTTGLEQGATLNPVVIKMNLSDLSIAYNKHVEYGNVSQWANIAVSDYGVFAVGRTRESSSITNQGRLIGNFGDLITDTHAPEVMQVKGNHIFTGNEMLLSVYLSEATGMSTTNPISGSYTFSDGSTGNLTFTLDATGLGYTYTAQIMDAPINTTLTGTLSLRVEDELGNFQEHEYDLSVTEDNDAPQVEIVYRDPKVFIGLSSKVFVKATDNNKVKEVYALKVADPSQRVDFLPAMQFADTYTASILGEELGNVEYLIYVKDMDDNTTILDYAFEVGDENEQWYVEGVENGYISSFNVGGLATRTVAFPFYVGNDHTAKVDSIKVFIAPDSQIFGGEKLKIRMSQITFWPSVIKPMSDWIEVETPLQLEDVGNWVTLSVGDKCPAIVGNMLLEIYFPMRIYPGMSLEKYSRNLACYVVTGDSFEYFEYAPFEMMCGVHMTHYDPSDANEIVAFTFPEQVVETSIETNEFSGNLNAKLPFGTNLSSLCPLFQLSDGAFTKYNNYNLRSEVDVLDMTKIPYMIITAEDYSNYLYMTSTTLEEAPAIDATDKWTINIDKGSQKDFNFILSNTGAGSLVYTNGTQDVTKVSQKDELLNEMAGSEEIMDYFTYSGPIERGWGCYSAQLPSGQVFDNIHAIDFKVPAGQEWTIDQLSTLYYFLAEGSYPEGFEVRIMNDEAGKPGAIAESRIADIQTGLTLLHEIELDFDNPIHLNAGKYWISIHPVFDHVPAQTGVIVMGKKVRNSVPMSIGWFVNIEPAPGEEPQDPYVLTEWTPINEVWVDNEDGGYFFKFYGSKTTSSSIMKAAFDGGAILAGASENIKFNVDASDLKAGVYELNILFESNDPANGVLSVPVELTVNDATGVNEISEDVFGIYPNPTVNTFKVTSSIHMDKLHLIDARGNIVFTSEIKENDISGLDSGVYLVKIFTNSGNVFYKKIIKR